MQGQYQNIQIQPVQYLDNDTVFFLNKNTSVQPASVDFVKTPKGYYASLDPRTFDSPRSQRLEFDSPPLVSLGTQPQGNLDMLNSNQTGFYKDYDSIHGGNIKYYTDLGNDTPFGAPTYFVPNYTIPQLMIDPMGGIKPYYTRVPIMNKHNSIYDYSFDRDQCEWREDLLSQQNTQNNGFGAFQFYNDPSKYYPMYKFKTKGHFPWPVNNSCRK